MSVFSDYKVGALTDEQFELECRRMNRQDEWEYRYEQNGLYEHDDDESEDDYEEEFD